MRTFVTWIALIGLLLGSSPTHSAQITSRNSLSAGQKTTAIKLKTAATAAIANNPVDLADMGSPPTITQSASPDGALTQVVSFFGSPGSFRVSPGHKYIRTTENNALYLATANWMPATSANLSSVTSLSPTLLNGGEEALDWSITFVTSAPTIQLQLRVSSANVPYRFIVNNQFVARDGLITTQNYVKLAFGSSTPRTITVELQYSGSNFQSVLVGAGDVVSAPSTPTIYGVGTGDSYCEGISGITNANQTTYYNFDNMLSTSAKMVGVNMYRNSCVGGTGYWNGGGGSPGAHFNINGQMAFWATDYTYDVILFFAGFNDEGQTTNTIIKTNSLADWQLARSTNPNSLIVVGGIWGGNKGPGVATIASEVALYQQFIAWNDPFSIFIPVSTDGTAALTWLYGTGCEGATTGDGNADIYVSFDCTHTNRSGALYLAGRIAGIYRTAIARFKTNWLLERDLVPAANDNSPVWLRKVG